MMFEQFHLGTAIFGFNLYDYPPNFDNLYESRFNKFNECSR